LSVSHCGSLWGNPAWVFPFQWETGGGFGGSKPPPPPKFRRPSKIIPNSTRLWKLLKIAEFWTPTPQDVWKKGSKILKLLSVHNCFTLVMTNKLVVILNSLKVPKIKKILLYEMKFLLPYYSCLQNPWLGGYCPQIPVLSVLNWSCWTTPPRNKIPGYATVQFPQANVRISSSTRSVTVCHKSCLHTLFKVPVISFDAIASTIETVWLYKHKVN